MGHEGRWHFLGQAVIYAASTYSLALLEKLVYTSGEMPPNQHFVVITIPPEVSRTRVDPEQLPGWMDPSYKVSQAYGGAWFSSQRTCVLEVPSVLSPFETNVVINTRHSDFAKISDAEEKPVRWDSRLFA